MKFEQFELERNQSLFENEVDYNLSESGVHPLKLSEILSNKIAPISDEIKRLINDKEYLDKILLEGVNKADEIADKKIKEMKKIIGF